MLRLPKAIILHKIIHRNNFLGENCSVNKILESSMEDFWVPSGHCPQTSKISQNKHFCQKFYDVLT
jgi:hypothetical protein